METAIRHTVLALPTVAVAVTAVIVAGIPLLYGTALRPAVELGLIMLPGSLLLGVGMTTTSILLARGRTAAVLGLGSAIVPATMLAYALAVPTGGATAAALICSVSFCAFAVLAVAVLRAVTGFVLRDILLPRRSDTGDYRVLARRIGARVRRGRGQR